MWIIILQLIVIIYHVCYYIDNYNFPKYYYITKSMKLSQLFVTNEGLLIIFENVFRPEWTPATTFEKFCSKTTYFMKYEVDYTMKSSVFPTLTIW